jgi:hypothetical protein
VATLVSVEEYATLEEWVMSSKNPSANFARRIKGAVSPGALIIILDVGVDTKVGKSGRSTSIKIGTDSTSSPDAAAPVAVKA